jgi:hypothetical protein
MKEEIEGEAPERARVERLGHFCLLPSAPKKKEAVAPPLSRLRLS